MTAHRLRGRITLGLAIGVVVTLGAGHLLLWKGFRLNYTSSMPLGLWRLTPLAAAPSSGQIVLACMEDTPITKLALERHYYYVGDCPSGTEPVPKPIGAVAGDLVEVSPYGISVNGDPIPDTAQLSEDSLGRALPVQPPGEYRVGQGEVWLISNHTPRSFDSRYTGPVPEANIKGLINPVWTWD